MYEQKITEQQLLLAMGWFCRHEVIVVMEMKLFFFVILNN